jgi:hypothetical protein
MATLPSEFQDLADELINDEFTAFKKPFTATRPGAFDPVTETYLAGQSFIIGGIPSALKDKQFQNQLIQVGDFNLVINPRTTPTSGVYFEPRINDQCTFDSKPVQIVSKGTDAADAAIQLVCRYL